jgi:plasmid stability protein
VKVTLDLPDDLVRKVKVRAAVEGRRMRELVADLLRTGLKSGKERSQGRPMVGVDEATGLPMVICAPVQGGGISAHEVQELIDATQEQEDVERAGLSV